MSATLASRSNGFPLIRSYFVWLSSDETKVISTLVFSPTILSMLIISPDLPISSPYNSIAALPPSMALRSTGTDILLPKIS